MTPAEQVQAVTDAAALRGWLQRHLPGCAEGRLRIDALRLHHLRRNTSQQRNPLLVTLGCELDLCDTAERRQGTQRLYGEVFRDADDARACADTQRVRPLAAPAFGPALAHVPDLHLVLWAMPNDPGLPQLPALLDPVRAAALVPGAAGRPLQVTLLRHEPRQRATLRYQWPGDAPGVLHTVYAKAFRDDRAALIDERFVHFWAAAASDPQAPLVAQPLGHDAAHRVAWQAPAPGRPLRERVAAPGTPDEAAMLLARTADALAALHHAPLRPAAAALPRTVAHWVAEVGRRRQKLARVDGTLAARADAVAQAVVAHAPAQASRPLSLIHGDFHPDQCWVHEGRIVLFDFDEFTWGDPMEDLAGFVLKLLHGGTPAALARGMVARYAHSAPALFDAAGLRWHLAIQSLLQACRAHRMQPSGWRAALDTWLADAQRRAAALHAPGPDPMDPT